MSKNLFKAYYLNRNTENARIINSNDVVAQKLESIGFTFPTTGAAMEATDGFEPVDLYADSPVLDPAAVLSGEYDPEQMLSGGMDAEQPMAEPEPVYEGPTPEELIAQAQEEIEIMRTNAMNEIDSLRMNAIETAQAHGYEEGKKEAMRELENAKRELEQERMQMQAFYERQLEELEPMFVRTLTGIYEKVFECGLDNQQEIVVNLLRNTMKKLDGCKNFLVHVSSADYPFVKEHKNELLSDSSQEGTVIDVVEDSMMRENECTIETINGIYDCGLGTQLSELRKKLVLLSYDGRQES